MVAEVDESIRAQPSRWRRARGILVVFALALAVSLPFAPRTVLIYDGAVMAQVAVSLADHATPMIHPIDGFGLNTPYSSYGIGTSIVMAALYKVGGAVGADQNWALASTNSFLYAGIVAAVFALLRRRRFPPSIVVGVTALFALGTPLLAYSTSSFSEPGVALALALGLVALDASEKGDRVAPVWVGAAIGAAGLMRTDSWILVGAPMIVALGVLAGRRGRAVGLAVVGLLPFAAVWAAYNVARYGSPFTSGYQLQFSHPLISGLYGLALSPGRGVFIYAPVLVLALAVLPFQRGGNRVFANLAFSMLVLRLLFYARWWSWYGGDTWGPRFMTPVLPAFAPLVADACWRWRRTPVPYLVAAASVTMSVIGLLVTTSHIPLSYAQPPVDHAQLDIPMASGPDGLGERLMRQWTSREFVEATDAIMFDWSRFPTRSSADGQETGT